MKTLRSRAFTLVISVDMPISNLSFPVCLPKTYYTAKAQVVTRQSLVGRVAVAPTNWQLTLAKRKRLEGYPSVSLVSRGYAAGFITIRFFHEPPSKKDDFTSSYRGNAVEGGAETSPVSTGKWLGDDAAEFLQSETTRNIYGTLVSQI